MILEFNLSSDSKLVIDTDYIKGGIYRVGFSRYTRWGNSELFEVCPFERGNFGIYLSGRKTKKRIEFLDNLVKCDEEMLVRLWSECNYSEIADYLREAWKKVSC